MNWIALNSLAHLDQLKEASFNRPQVIFKHSTRCSISSMAKNRLERATKELEADFHYLDLIQFRSVSNEIEHCFGIAHESPQVLIIRQATCVFDSSHNGISASSIEEALQEIRA